MQESHHKRLKAGHELAQAGLQTTLVALHFLQRGVFQDLEKARNTVRNSNLLSPDSLLFFKAVGSREDAGGLEHGHAWGFQCSNLLSACSRGTKNRRVSVPSSRSPFLSQGAHARLYCEFYSCPVLLAWPLSPQVNPTAFETTLKTSRGEQISIWWILFCFCFFCFVKNINRNILRHRLETQTDIHMLKTGMYTGCPIRKSLPARGCGAREGRRVWTRRCRKCKIHTKCWRLSTRTQSVSTIVIWTIVKCWYNNTLHILD